MSRVLEFPPRQAADAPAPRQGECPYEGYRLAFEVHGDDSAPTVILVHGILLDAACNRDLAIMLAAQGFRVVLLDLLGHGRSDKPGHAKELRIDFFAEQLATLMDHLRLERAIIGGVSLGAITCLQFAAQWPERVTAMFLEMPVMERATPAAALMLVPVLALVRYAAPVQRVIARNVARLPRPKRNLTQVAYNGLTQQPEDIASIIHDVLTGPVVPPRRARSEIQAPALVIGHAGDWLHNLEDARILAKELPNARFIEAKSMFELRTRPQRLMPQIVEFFNAARERRSGAA